MSRVKDFEDILIDSWYHMFPATKIRVTSLDNEDHEKATIVIAYVFQYFRGARISASKSILVKTIPGDVQGAEMLAAEIRYHLEDDLSKARVAIHTEPPEVFRREFT